MTSELTLNYVTTSRTQNVYMNSFEGGGSSSLRSCCCARV